MSSQLGQAGDFGGRLREARERRGMSLRQIANATKISVAVLEALERNDVSRLPGGIFGRAFVRSYAVEVGLDPERTIHEFITRFPLDTIVVGHPAVRQAEIGPQIHRSSGLAAPMLFAAAVALAAVGLTVYFDAWRSLASFASRLVSEPFAPARARDLTPRPPDSAARSEADDAVAAGEADRARAAAPEGTAVPAAAADDRLTVRLSVSRPCWVSAMVDGRKAIERLLQTGEDQTIDVRREIVLTAADAGAVALTLNGAIAKPLGSAGEVVTARLSLANFRDFLSGR